MRKAIGVLILLVMLLVGLKIVYFDERGPGNADPEPTACPADGKVCSDGTVLVREGPNCEFPACPEPATTTDPMTVPDDIQAHIDEKRDLIRLDTPAPLAAVESPLTVTGEARGTWYFEATFSLVLVDWDGRIVAEHYAEAEDDWMTEQLVPFSGTLEFESPYSAGDPDFMKRGALILQKANPSGLPENDDALEVPIRFAE